MIEGVYFRFLKWTHNESISIFLSRILYLVVCFVFNIKRHFLKTNTSHTQKGVKLSVYNGLGTKIIIMPPTTAQHMPLMALSDNSVGC